MKSIYINSFLSIFCFCFVFYCSNGQSQESYLGSIDPHSDVGIPYADKGSVIRSHHNSIFIKNGYRLPVFGRANNLIKIDKSNLEVSKIITITGIHGDFTVTDFIISTDDFVYLTGEWYDTIQSDMQIFIAKYDMDLNEIWTHYLEDLAGETREEHAYSICETSYGGIAVAYTTKERFTNRPYLNVFTADKDGNLGLNRRIASPVLAQNIGRGNIYLGPDGNYLISSYLGDYAFEISPYSESSIREASLIQKLNPLLDTIWSRYTPGSSSLIRYQNPLSTITDEGNLAVAWIRDTFVRPEIDNPYTYLPRYYGVDCYDTDGNHIWKYDRVEYNVSHVSLTTAANGDIIAAGYHTNLFIWDNWYKAWIYRLSPRGELKWSRIYNDSIRRHYDPFRFPINPTAVTELDDGRIALTGWIIDESDHPQSNGINPNVLLMVLDSMGCLIPGCTGEHQVIDSTSSVLHIPQPEILQLHVYPNPVLYQATVSLPESISRDFGQGLVLQAYDAQGRKIWEDRWDGIARQLNTDNWPSGLVYLICIHQGIPMAGTKIIIHSH
jgi:hypothetical protein